MSARFTSAFKALVLLCWLTASFAACKTQPRVDPFEAPCEVAEGWSPSSGVWVFRYAGGEPLAYGAMRGGVKVRSWWYWYPDGRPLGMACFDDEGRLSGYVVAFDRNGVVNHGSQALRMEGWQLYFPIVGDVDWLQFGRESRFVIAHAIMPSPWRGCGVFVDGVRTGPISEKAAVEIMTEATRIRKLLPK